MSASTGWADIRPTAVLTGDIALSRINSWVGIPTVQAAMAIDAPVLLARLSGTRDNDEKSYRNMIAALRQKNPRFKIWLTVKETSETFGADEVELRLSGPKDVTSGAAVR